MLTLLDKESTISQGRWCIFAQRSVSLNLFFPRITTPSAQHKYHIPWSAVDLQAHAFYMNRASSMCCDQGPGHH